jgi:hypothetical protein
VGGRERAFGCFDGYATPHFERVLLRREIERPVERMQAERTFGSITGAGHLHHPEDAFQAASMRRSGLQCGATGILRRLLGSFPVGAGPNALAAIFASARFCGFTGTRPFASSDPIKELSYHD